MQRTDNFNVLFRSMCQLTRFQDRFFFVLIRSIYHLTRWMLFWVDSERYSDIATKASISSFDLEMWSADLEPSLFVLIQNSGRSILYFLLWSGVFFPWRTLFKSAKGTLYVLIWSAFPLTRLVERHHFKVILKFWFGAIFNGRANVLPYETVYLTIFGPVFLASFKTIGVIRKLFFAKSN